MFRIFEAIFGKDDASPGRYPDTLVEKAMGRALDATDPRLCAVAGYKKKLRPAVIHAIDHVFALVDGLPPPVELSAACRSDSRLSLFFMSSDHVREVVGADPSVAEFLKTDAGRAADDFVALLLLRLKERQVFGTALEGEILKRDVPQVTVSVSDRRLVDPAPSEELAPQLLKRRAFDHLLGIALRRIAAAVKERAGLAQERTLLRRKFQVLKSAGWTFESGDAGGAVNAASIEAKLDEIEQQLEALGGDTGALNVNLERLIEVLAAAEKQLWRKRRRLIVDRMGIKREQPSETAPELDLDELHNVLGETAIMLPVRIPRREVPRGDDVFEKAKRTLGY